MFGGGAGSGGMFGGLFGMLGDLTQQGLGNIFAKSEAKKARQFQREIYTNRYQWTVRDLEKAGLNPILAVTGGGMSGNIPGVAAARPSSAKSSLGDNLIRGGLMAAQKEQLKSSAAAAKAQERFYDAEAWRSTSQSALNYQTSARTQAEAEITRHRWQVYKKHPELMYRELLNRSTPNSLGGAVFRGLAGLRDQYGSWNPYSAESLDRLDKKSREALERIRRKNPGRTW